MLLGMKRWVVFAWMFVAAAAGAAGPKSVPVAEKVGVTERVFHPAARRNWRGAQQQELRCIIWYPAAENVGESVQVIGPPASPLMIEGKAAPHAEMAPALEKRPLILLSHGSGGSAAQMAWLGIALARAGMIAVAVNHPGNNALEPYTPEGFMLWWERATDMSEVLDGMLADEDFGPRIDTRMIGAAGFSLGGYTVLELAGARTDVTAVERTCTEHPELEMCHTPEMKDLPHGASLLERVRKTSGESLARSADSFRDPRVKAVFAIAPGPGMALTAESLKQLRVPAEVVVGASDRFAPAAGNADWIRENGHGVREVVLPGGVGHYTFLSTCTDAGRKEMGVYCEDAPGVNRDAVHVQVSGMAVEFFERDLKWK
jgi:predicted dienelactone hydrolase